MPGSSTPATIGSNIDNISWRPRKYHGALEGFGVLLVLASSSSGAFTKIEKMSVKARQSRAATNSMESRCGHTCTLSCGVALTSWMDPDLTTVSRRWVWPPGPAATGGAAVATAVPAVAVAVATPAPPPGASEASPPAALLRAAFARSRRCAGILLSAALGAAASAAAGASSPSPASGLAAAALARASSARLRRCSGISVIDSPPVLQGTADAAVLADTPEVDSHEDHDHEREHEHVQHVPAQQRVGADLAAAEEHEAHLVSEDRGVAHHVRAHGHRPERQLVPRQQVAGEREQQGEEQQHDADHPVELPRRLVGAVVEDACHVQEHRQDHEVGRPSVHVPHQ